MESRYPNLHYVLKLYDRCDRFAKYRSPRVTVLEFFRLGQTDSSFTRADIDSPQSLWANLSQAHSREGSEHKRVYMMESLTPEYIEIFGWHFNIDPIVFANQIRSTNWEDPEGHGYGNLQRLLSDRDPGVFFLLRYYEIRKFSKEIENLATTELEDACTGRKISFARIRGQYHGIGVVRRNASFWKRRVGQSGWDGMLSFYLV
jgi:hypothetical protein